MDLGAPELQVFVSLVVILGAAFVALVCDYLKGHNEQLRERNIELRARLDERERIVRAETASQDPASWLDALASRATGESDPLRASEPAFGKVRPALAAPRAKRAEFDRQPQVVPSSWDPSLRTPAWAEVTEVHPEISPASPPPVLPLDEIERRVSMMTTRAETEPPAPPAPPRKSRFGGRFKSLLSGKPAEGRSAEESNGDAGSKTPSDTFSAGSTDLNSPPVVEDHAPDITNLGGALMTAGKGPSVETETAPDVPVPVAAAAVEVSDATHAVLDTNLPESSAPTAPVQDLYAEPVPDAEAEPVLAPFIEAAEEGETLLLEATIPAEQSPAEAPAVEAVTPGVTVPHGLFGPDTWNGLLSEERPFNGVVFCVGIADHSRLLEAHGQPGVDQVTKSLMTSFESVVAESGFAAQVSPDTFVLIFKDERGAIAQRRINGISERLWDHQLRSLGPMSVLFSWGAVEVESEPIGAAFAAAVERMNQSRRNRRGPSIDSSRKLFN